MTLKLQKIEIKNYGNLKSVTLDNLGNLNILIGPNNCGKTHILKAISELNKFATAIKREGSIYGSIYGVERGKSTLKERRTVLKLSFI